MRVQTRTLLSIVCLLLLAMLVQWQTAASPPTVVKAGQGAHIVQGYGTLPLGFEANEGQSDSQVKFLSRGAGYSLFLTSTEAVLTLGKVSREKPVSRGAKSLPTKSQPVTQEKRNVLRMKLLGANAKAIVTGQDELTGKSNYFLGNDPKKWRTNVPRYAKVRYVNIYPGIDLVYYGNQRELEYDFVVQPGADPTLIRLGIEGAKNIRLEQGDLVLSSTGGDVHVRQPHIYQQLNGAKHDIKGGYVLKDKNEAGFRLLGYDRTRALIIDPVLAYSTYLGGKGRDDYWSAGIAVDSAGNAYVTGDTGSTDFPITDAIQPTYHGNYDAFVTKINHDGTGLVYSTYLGGSGSDGGAGIAVDSAGNAYVTGSTASTDFPTLNPVQPTNHGGHEGFVTKINASGSALVYSTYLGGSYNDAALGIAVDAAGNAYVTGRTESADFLTANAIQPTNHGGADDFVTKINANGALVYSTYLGGSGDDFGNGIAVDSVANAYVVGITTSADFPTANALQGTYAGDEDTFVTKINAGGSAFVYSTYLGGSDYDWGEGVAVDSLGNACVTGGTQSSDFPIVNAIQPTKHLGLDAFVTKIFPDGSALVYSTYLGGNYVDEAYGIAVDAAGNTYITGATRASDFPMVNAIESRYKGGVYWGDVFVTKINPDATALVYSTYLGGGQDDKGMGIAVDVAGSAYVTGGTYSKQFPHTAFAFQQSLKGYSDAFISKIASQTFVSVSPTKIGFGTLMIGKTSAPKQLVVTNEGSGTLTIDKIFVGGANGSDFAETNNCPSTLSPGGFCSISVTFTPTAEDKRQAVLVISDSDPESPQSIPLSGTGTVVSLSPKSLTFGKVPVGRNSAPKTVILTNVGSTQLNFAGISITGQNPTDYSQTNSCGMSIDAEANCTMTVTFTPTATGTRKATVSISDDGGGSPQKIALTGTGT